ncbi:DNA hydrolase, partial [Spirillospora sp. NPDC049652]
MNQPPQDEREFLAAYDPRAFDPVSVTVDVVALTIRDGALNALL